MAATEERQSKIREALAGHRKVGRFIDPFVLSIKNSEGRFDEGFYERINYRYANKANHTKLPAFLEEAIGPPLRLLPSFVVLNPKNIVLNPKKFPQEKGKHPEIGIGDAIETAHQEMRDLAKRIAAFTFQGMPRNMNFTPREGKFENVLDDLPAKHTIHIKDDAGGPDVHLTLERPLLKKVLAMGSAAVHILGRDDLPENVSIGGSKLFKLVGDVASDLRREIHSKGVENQEIKKLLNLDVEKIQAAFIRQEQHFRDIRMLVQIAFDGKPPQGICKICDIDPEKKMAVENPKDAACAVFALGAFVGNPNRNFTQTAVGQLSDKIAHAQNDKEAQKLLKDSWDNVVAPLTKTAHHHEAAVNAAVSALQEYKLLPAKKSPNVAIRRYTDRERFGPGGRA